MEVLAWTLRGQPSVRVQVYTFIMQELVKYRGMYTSMAELLKSGTPGPDLHAHHDLLASALPPGSGGQVWHPLSCQTHCWHAMSLALLHRWHSLPFVCLSVQ